MAAAIQRSLNQNAEVNTAPIYVGQNANDEELVMMIAQNESAKEEAQRQKVARLKHQQEQREKNAKIYDEVVFNYAEPLQKNPKLFKVKVQHISDLKIQDPDAINIDGEYFIKKQPEFDAQPTMN